MVELGFECRHSGITAALVGQLVKNPPAPGDQGSVPTLGIFPGEGWVPPSPVFWPGLQSWTQLSDLRFHSGMRCLLLKFPTPAKAIIVGSLEDLVEEEEFQIIQKGRKRGCSGRKWGNNIS